MESAALILVTTQNATGDQPDGKCEGCESLYVIHLYTSIASRRAENVNLIVVRTARGRDEPDPYHAEPYSETGVDL